MKKIVLKFGGSVLTDLECFHQASKIIKVKAQSHSVCVVVSAMQGTTDQLLQLAKEINPNPNLRELDALLSTGEVFSMTLLALALQKEGVAAISLTGEQAGITTSSQHGDAKITNVRSDRILSELNAGKVVIIAGFQGVNARKETTTLGRGGSDITAVALAIALSCKWVEFYKDVEGIYSFDPKICKDAEILRDISYERALQITRGENNILHPRCILLAESYQIILFLLSFFDPNSIGTKISDLNCAKKPNFLYEWESVYPY